MITQNIEALLCEMYIEQSSTEQPFDAWLLTDDISIITTQGFEERSVGLIESYAKSGLKADNVIVALHTSDKKANFIYKDRFEIAIKKVTSNSSEVNLDADGLWLKTALSKIKSSNVLLDITGIGTRGLFGTLDIASLSNKNIFITYTEAKEYWPKKEAWDKMKEDLTDSNTLPDVVDNQPWLFGYEHKVEFIPGHDGYDSAGTARALIGFLPYKYARLAAVMSADDYTHFEFIAGRPKLEENLWRSQALLEINRDLLKGKRVIEMSTFGYHSALERLSQLILTNEAMLDNYDVHIALMGSKLQDVACWVLSCLVPSLTVLTAVPSKYFPQGFSDGVGETWFFPLLPPNKVLQKIQ